MANQQSKAGSGQSEGDSTGIMLMVGLVAVMIWALWWKGHTVLSTGYAWIRAVELSVFWALSAVHQFLGLLFYPAVGTVILIPFAILAGLNYTKKQAWVSSLLIGAVVSASALLVSDTFAGWVTFFVGSDKSLITIAHWVMSSLWVNGFILITVIVPLAIWISKTSTKTNPYNFENFGKSKDYSLDSFTDSMSHVYPHLKLFRKLNLPAKSINTGKYRMGDTEKQFVINNDLLDEVKPGDFRVNRERAAEIFRQQLGRPWTGFNNLSRYEMAVMAVLLPRIAATDPKMKQPDYKAALELTNTLIAQYWRDAADSYDEVEDTLTIDMTAAKDAIRKYGKHRRCQTILNRHAYVGTAIYDLLSTSRGLGVLAACDLRWLRVVNRPLWLMVDTVGRITAFTESGGVYAHFLHEAKRQRAIEKPMIDSAVKGLVEAVDSFCFAEHEIEEIRRLQDENLRKATAAKESIDLKTVAPTRAMVYLALLPVGAETKDIYAAAVLAANGDILFDGTCKPAVDVTSDDEELYDIDDGVLDKLNDRGVTSKVMRKKLLEVCNGCDVQLFSAGESDLIPMLERSATSVTVMRSAPEFTKVAGSPLQLVQAGEKAGYYTPENKAPSIQTAVANAKALRAISLWVAKESIKQAATAAT